MWLRNPSEKQFMRLAQSVIVVTNVRTKDLRNILHIRCRLHGGASKQLRKQRLPVLITDWSRAASSDKANCFSDYRHIYN